MPTNSKLAQTDQSPVTQPPTPFQVMLRAMAMDASSDDSTFGGDDLNTILSAESEAELWESDDRPPLNFQHLAGCELSIMDIEVKFSRGGSNSIITPFTWQDERGQEKKMYLLVKCVRISDASDNRTAKLPPVGEVFQANTSARFVVAKLWRALTLGLYDANRMITWDCMVESTDLGDGTAVIKLRQVPKRVTRSTAE
jgi:hypothetical protein